MRDVGFNNLLVHTSFAPHAGRGLKLVSAAWASLKKSFVNFRPARGARIETD